MYRKLVHLLLIFFSVSILGLTFHHHADGVPHQDCSICSFASHHSNLTLQNAPQISAPCYNIFVISLESATNICYPFYYPYSNRAPPA